MLVGVLFGDFLKGLQMVDFIWHVGSHVIEHAQKNKKVYILAKLPITKANFSSIDLLHY